MKNMNETIVQDVDECLFNSVAKHQIETPKKAKELGYDWPDELPTYEQVCAAGGTNKAYGHLPGYPQINEFLRNDHSFNSNQELIPGALEALTLLESQFFIYLTTRPEHLAQLTIEELRAAGFPEREVITRPEYVPIEKTAEWKLEVLKELLAKTGKPKVMIDDSPSMYKVITASEHENIRGILHAGPNTPKNGIDMTWKEIQELFVGVETWAEFVAKVNAGRRV